MGKTRATAGHLTVTVDDTALVKMLDRVTNGAASHFIEAVETDMGEVRVAALPTWPVRTGESRAGLSVGHEVRPDKVLVSITDREDYTYKVRWSVRTKDSLDAEIEEAAARGGDTEAQAKIRKYYQRRLWKRHGKGAPSDKLAGRHVWTTLVRTPLKRRRPALMKLLQTDLERLAGAT